MDISLPTDALVVLIGAAGCGKSTFAATRFSPTQIVSSDECRALVSDDEANAAASKDAFILMHLIIEMRLKRGRLTLADATNVRADKRKELVVLARRWRRPVVAIVFDLPAEVCQERNRRRSGRVVPPAAVGGQLRDLRESLPLLPAEGFAAIHILTSAAEVEGVGISTSPGSSGAAGV